MRHTFGQAKLNLARYASSYGLVDLSASVNTAIDELSRSRVWQRLRKVMRFTATSEYFSLPQDCGTLVRAAIDRVPVSIRSTDYEFLHTGPGDLDFVDAGLAPLHGVQRVGVFPTMNAIVDILPLAAFSTAAPSSALRVRGKDANGDRIVATVPVTVWSGLEAAADLVASTVTKTTLEFADIDSVVVPGDATAYISLYSVGDELSLLSRMHPKVAVPEFTRYRLPGFSSTTDASYRVLAEVALRFLPLVDDDEVIPFDSLLPIQFMLQSLWAMESGEIKTADEYRQRAVLALLGREENELERQTLLVLNPLYDGSVGQASSEEYYNI